MYSTYKKNAQQRTIQKECQRKHRTRFELENKNQLPRLRLQ